MTQSRPIDARPTVYMLVEIKVRELRAKLHLALCLAERGFRVYVGARGAITRAIEARPERAGVYYFKGGERSDTLRAIRGACEFIVGQDEEIGPALTRRDVAHAWRTRIAPSTAELIDELYLYAPGHQRVLGEIHRELAQRSVVTGWPRADLWSPSLRQPDERDANRIRAEHGEFALFVSNFKVTSEEQRDRVVAAARQRRLHLDDELGRQSEEHGTHTGPEFGTKASARLSAFERTVELLRKAAARSSVPIVVRPHPAEDPMTWRRALRDADGVSVIYEGEVGPWVMASSAMLHTGCTTAVQAAHYEVACGELVEGKFASDDEPSAASLVSHALASVDDVTSFIDTAVGTEGGSDKQSPMGDHDAAWLGSMDGLAAKRIAERMSTLNVTPELPLRPLRRVSAQRTVAVAVGHARRWLGSITRSSRFVGTNAQAKVPGGIHLKEARRLVDSLNGPTVSIREPRFDLIEIASRDCRGCCET